jgi:hypothetical protein
MYEDAHSPFFIFESVEILSHKPSLWVAASAATLNRLKTWALAPEAIAQFGPDSEAKAVSKMKRSGRAEARPYNAPDARLKAGAT